MQVEHWVMSCQVRLVRSAVRPADTTIGVYLKTLEVEESKVNRLARQIDSSRKLSVITAVITH